MKLVGLGLVGRAVGDERHCLFDCPRFGDLRSKHAQLFHDAHGGGGGGKSLQSVQPAKAYEDESVMMFGPHSAQRDF